MNYNMRSLVRVIQDGWLPFPLSVVPPSRKPFLWQLTPFPIYDDVEALGKYLEEAVAKSIQGYDRFGVWLSGGIDSSTLLYYLTRLTDNQVKCYTVDFGYMGEDVDNAINLTKELKVSHQITKMKTSDHLRLLEETTLNLRYPSDTWTVVPFVQKLAERDGCDCTLSALGLDELVGGYSVHVNASDSEYVEVERRCLELCHANFAWNQIHAYPSIHLGLPFLDKSLVGFCRGLPRGLKTQGQHTKVALRKIMTGKLPERIVSAGDIVDTKGGFTPLITAWWDKGLKQFCEEEISKLPLWLRILINKGNLWKQMRLACTPIFFKLLKEGAYG